MTYLPSRPANGDVLTPNVIRSTGSSTISRVSATGDSDEAMVSPISTSGNPATTNRSPADSSSTSLRLTPFERHQLGEATLQRRLTLVRTPPRAAPRSRRGASTPLTTRPMARRPRYSLASRVVTIACSGASGSPVGAGMASRMVSSSGDRSASSPGMPMPLIGLAFAGNGRDDLEVDVVVAGVEVDEQLVDLVEHLVGAGVAAVDLVDDDDRRQIAAPAPSAARSGSAAADPRRHRPAAARRRPSSAPARPRHRSRRGRACRPG